MLGWAFHLAYWGPLSVSTLNSHPPSGRGPEMLLLKPIKWCLPVCPAPSLMFPTPLLRNRAHNTPTIMQLIKIWLNPPWYSLSTEDCIPAAVLKSRLCWRLCCAYCKCKCCHVFHLPKLSATAQQYRTRPLEHFYSVQYSASAESWALPALLLEQNPQLQRSKMKVENSPKLVKQPLPGTAKQHYLTK